MNVVVLKMKNIFFCLYRRSRRSSTINVFFMKPNVNLIFFMIMAALKWIFAFFWHDYVVVNLVENYKKIFGNAISGFMMGYNFSFTIYYFRTNVQMSTIPFPIFVFVCFSFRMVPLVQGLIYHQQFVYLGNFVPLYSAVQTKYFLQSGSIFWRNPQNNRKKSNRKKN